MKKCWKNSTKLALSALVLIALIYGITLTSAQGDKVAVFSKNELPLGKPYESWIQDWWRWTAALPSDPVTTIAGVKENGCLIKKDGPVVMLLDTAVGGQLNQRCEISRDQGILFPLWSAECDASVRSSQNMTSKQLSDRARELDLGKIKGNVWVDNTPVAKLDVNDYNTIELVNATEVYTNGFNITTPKNSHLAVDIPGTYPGAVHGWFVFLKPLTTGEHNVRYLNDVRPTTLSGAANTNHADITYSLTVK